MTDEAESESRKLYLELDEKIREYFAVVNQGNPDWEDRSIISWALVYETKDLSVERGASWYAIEGYPFDMGFHQTKGLFQEGIDSVYDNQHDSGKEDDDE